jgi:hypothetical protein
MCRYMRQKLTSIEAEGLVAGQELALIKQEVATLYPGGRDVCMYICVIYNIFYIWDVCMYMLYI